jgi:carotenoid cleavage dioxygenase
VSEALGEAWPGGPVHEKFDFAANTHVVEHAGRIYATVEAGPLPYELTDELSTVGPSNFGGTLPGGFAAHTKLDGVTRELHAIAYFWAWDHVQHIIINPAGQVRATTNIPVADGTMMHDFALTQSYVILLDLPVTFSMDALSAGRQMPYTWNPAHQARVGLLRRDGVQPETQWIEVEPCWVFHTLNAYDQDGKVVLDLCKYEGQYEVSMMRGAGPVTLERWIIDPSAGTVFQLPLDDQIQEFPRVDDRVTSQRHRYGYTAVIAEGNRAALSLESSLTNDARENFLLKHDFDAGIVESHAFGSYAATGEAVFAPSKPDAAEDDGYVLSFVQNADRGTTDLVILAAQDFLSEPVATVHLPVRVPLGFHGNWIPDER